MSTSASINYSTSASEIITEALELLGVLGEGQTYTSDQYTSSSRTLNMMIKTWQASGLNLFAVKKSYLFFNIGQKEYTLNSTTTDHWTDSFEQTTTSAAATSGDNSIEVTSASGLSTTMKIGIQTSGTEVYWDTIASISGSTIGLTGTLPADVASGYVVYAYSTTANRPMRLLEAYVRRYPNGSSPVDIPVWQLSRVDYWQRATKNTSAQTIEMYFDPQRTSSTLSVWPVSSSEIDYAILVCQRTLEDFDSSSDEPDFPQEWFGPLAYNLAVMLAPKYGIPAMDYQRLMQQAAALYKVVFDWDTEQETSVYFRPDNWGTDIGRKGN